MKSLKIIFENKLWILGTILSLIFCLNPIKDNDLGWHLSTGKLIFSQLAIPKFDTLSYSIPGYELVLHSWLLDLFIYIFYFLAGLTALNLFYGLIIAASVTFLVHKMSISKSVALIFPGITLLVVSILGLRTQITSFGLALVLIGLLYSERDTEKKSSSLFAIPLLFLVWANLHGGVVNGILILSSWLLLDFYQDWIQKKLSLRRIKNSLIILTASASATLVTPAGMRLYSYIWQMATNVTAAQFNQDWLPLYSPLLPGSDLPFRIGLLILALTLVIFSSHLQLRLITVTFLLLSFTSIRYLLPLTSVLLPLGLEVWKQHQGKLQQKITQVFLCGIIVYGCLLFIRWPTINDWWCSINSLDCYARLSHYPFNSIKKLESFNHQLHIFNYYDWGGYIAWALPTHKIFIDGRMDNFFINGESFLVQFVSIFNAQTGWSEALARFDTNVVLLPPTAPLVAELRKQPSWVILNETPNEVLFKKEN